MIENHLLGTKSFDSEDTLVWSTAMGQLLKVPVENVLVTSTSLIENPGRRSLSTPELNVTAEITFDEEADLVDLYETLVDELGRTQLNILFDTVLNFQEDLEFLTSVWLGLAGTFDLSNYYYPTVSPSVQPTFEPTNKPTKDPTLRPTKVPTSNGKATPKPTKAPSSKGDALETNTEDDSGTTVTIVLDGVDPNDDDLLDDIANVTTTVIGSTTDVISITPNDDGTVTVVLDVACNFDDCGDDLDDQDIVTAVEVGLNDAGHSMNVVSMTPEAKNGNGDEMKVIAPISTFNWMIVALVCASCLCIYTIYTNRETFCVKKEKVLDIQDVFDLAKPNNVGPAPFADDIKLFKTISQSSIWTQYTDVEEGNRTNYETDATDEEGEETMEVVCPDVAVEGDETRMEGFEHEETGYDSEESVDGEETKIVDHKEPVETEAGTAVAVRYCGRKSLVERGILPKDEFESTIHDRNPTVVDATGFESDETVDAPNSPTAELESPSFSLTKRAFPKQNVQGMFDPSLRVPMSPASSETASETYYEFEQHISQESAQVSDTGYVSSPSALQSPSVMHFPHTPETKRGGMQSRLQANKVRGSKRDPTALEQEHILQRTWELTSAQTERVPRKRVLKAVSSRSLSSVYE